MLWWYASFHQLCVWLNFKLRLQKGEETFLKLYSLRISHCSWDYTKYRIDLAINFIWMLIYQVDTFYAVGSPLGVFLSLHNVRIGLGNTWNGMSHLNISFEFSFNTWNSMSHFQNLVLIVAFHQYSRERERILGRGKYQWRNASMSSIAQHFSPIWSCSI